MQESHIYPLVPFQFPTGEPLDVLTRSLVRAGVRYEDRLEPPAAIGEDLPEEDLLDRFCVHLQTTPQVRTRTLLDEFPLVIPCGEDPGRIIRVAQTLAGRLPFVSADPDTAWHVLLIEDFSAKRAFDEYGKEQLGEISKDSTQHGIIHSPVGWIFVLTWHTVFIETDIGSSPVASPASDPSSHVSGKFRLARIVRP